ncbi:hypothetical protein LCGC14_0963310 [marine sediment metagenome]|uniref:Uncharacterized protein n=1 Tax=marine sediment metagenome TaxID=412755 RepID=A0A0F9RKD4_9ZZZZ
MRKRYKKGMKLYQKIIILMVSLISIMWIYGNVKHYFPDPVYIGLGQYFDIGVGIIIILLMISGIFIGMIFKKKKQRRK